ncbi:2-oxo acid dehydrogenase subunit E2 [Nocardioides daeguensis]|uniref:Dihydrolipoamide acetyltransferase component of pyruvate dehydrogenase complex n=1 Tax=Nocardioides daeguensis TaxID=908359 RepID=A0ABP6V8Y1_9ACTN|nr:2-oxo acid dehydrogenase subunit E2 [Nocardioides daeguensis]MBV6726463.1 2-oxo acid dehydrogenase subunit E2 [Nocardioides daeguensis]MCR1772306.1 2-oxo acid dehydrogenase subunit E2 [Nocardioides daeguensis]
MDNGIDIRVPDIGDFSDVPVIEVLVAPGSVVRAEDPLITLETDKATMEVPSPVDGTIVSVSVKVGDTVSHGTVIAVAETASVVEEVAQQPSGDPEPAPVVSEPATPAVVPEPATAGSPDGGLRATPLVRRLARELDVDLAAVTGSGPKGRVTKQDLLTHYDRSVAPVDGGSPAGTGIPPVPEVDFAKFGPVRRVPLSRIKKISGPHLQRSWLNVPHVTHCDEADITDLDAYRRELDADAKADGYRVTLLSFLLKAAAATLRTYPEVNSSLSGEELVLKDYVHVGVAVDTPDGLVVPVVRDVDRKGILEISRELADLSARARDGRLTASDMQGATFTISSLGGIGGTAFTPIVNAPEVAILGVVRSKTAPVWDGETFVPRLMLPLCLSYDHRVIDGALAARFTAHLAHLAADVRRLSL